MDKTISSPNRKLKISSGPVGQSNSVGSRLFDIFNYVFLTLVAVTTILPFVYIIGASFATEYEIATRPMFFIPQNVSTAAYEFIFSSNKILRGFANSIFITVCGTAINLFCTVTMAYALSKTRLRGRNFFLNMVIISMFFSGGMIPGYIVIANILNLSNTYWSVLLPGAISAYNMMIVKNFFQGIPQELEESASLDGCNDLMTLIRIVLPLSLPVLATFGLFYAVGHWNSYFSAMIYLTDDKMYPLQLILREILILSDTDEGFMMSETIQFATIVVATIPILCVYPFIQLYFVKGIMVGAVKG
jgi:putative aldouronate transport system permease protein